MVILAGSAIVLVIGLVVLVFVKVARNTTAPDLVGDEFETSPAVLTTSSTDPSAKPDDRGRSINDSVPLVTATTMSAWYPAEDAASAVVGNDKFQMERGGFTKTGNEWLFEGTLTARGVTPNAPTTLRVGLVDREDRVFTWYDMPITMMLSGQVRERINLTVSDKLHSRMSRWVWTVKEGRPIGGGAPFKDIVVEELNDSVRAAVRVTAYNPLQREATRAVVVVTAYDKADAQIGQWIMEWNDTIGAGQRVEFQSLLANRRDLDARRWKVEGAVLFKASP